MRLLPRAGLLTALCAATFAVGATFAMGAGATQARDTLIRPGVGIGKLRLGMTFKQARQALGQPLLVYQPPRGVAGGSLRVVFYESDNGLWQLELLGPRGKEKLVSISTSSKRESLGNGVGVGTLVSTLPQRLDPLNPRCISGDAFVNSRPIQVPVITCAITTEKALTIFFGDAECSVPTVRYQGCPEYRVPVVGVTVEGPELTRYRLSDWNP